MCNNNHARFHAMSGKYKHFMNHPNFRNWAKSNEFTARFSYPPVNIQEEDDHYEIELKVPGYEKVDFKISISDNILTIQSDKKNQDQGFVEFNQFRQLAFKRQFELNEKINLESIKAEYLNGILKLRLEKKEDFHTQRTEIRVD